MGSSGTSGSTEENRMQVVRRCFERLYRLVGKDYEVDSEVPSTVLAGILLRRSAWLARGLVLGRGAAFVGPAVHIRGLRGLRMARAATIEGGCRIDAVARRGVVLGARSKLGAGTVVSCTSHISRLGEGFVLGADASMGEWCYVGASGGVSIGDDVIMGQFVTFHSQHHEYEAGDETIRRLPTSEQGIVIDRGCWVGAKATFLDGTHVGAGSVVAAGAVVRGRFPPGSVIGGVPARILKTREPAPK